MSFLYFSLTVSYLRRAYKQKQKSCSARLWTKLWAFSIGIQYSSIHLQLSQN